MQGIFEICCVGNVVYIGDVKPAQPSNLWPMNVDKKRFTLILQTNSHTFTYNMQKFTKSIWNISSPQVYEITIYIK